MLEESVIYQDILQKGEQRGLQQGKQQGLEQGLEQGLAHEQRLVLRQLERKLDKLSAKARKQVERLDFERLAMLGEDLLDFTNEQELFAWLKQHAVAH